jgi:hypothetical protein
MVGRPIGDRAMTPAERQARRRARLAEVRNRDTEETLLQLRQILGRMAFYLAGQPPAGGLAAALATIGGPQLPLEVLVKAATWLSSFAETYRLALLFQQLSVMERD